MPNPFDVLSQTQQNMMGPTEGLYNLNDAPQTYSPSEFSNPLSNGGASSNGSDTGNSIMNFMKGFGNGFLNDLSYFGKVGQTAALAVADPIKSLRTGQPVNTFQDIANLWSTPQNDVTKNAISGAIGESPELASKWYAPSNFLDTGSTFLTPGVGTIGKVAKAAGDLTHITPLVTKAADAVASSKAIQNPLIQGAKDAFGNAFVKDYGASPELSDAISRAEGNKAVTALNNLEALKPLQLGHGLTTDELNQVGHITEGTLQGTPEQQALAQSLSDLLKNGAANSGIGSSLLSQTASATTGEPMLQALRDNYFGHIYNNVPDELKGVFPRKSEGVGGLSPNGTYNLPRTFETLQEAQNAGLKPELNPFMVTGTRLNQMSEAFHNNQLLNEIKNTPGILFDKDPIDEVSKLIKTGQITKEQAAQQLGMSIDDLKKGFVQSQVPQLRGAYIRPADDKALMEYLNPSQPKGIFAAANKLNNLYNKGLLMNPLPHMHNVITNGIGLGGAKIPEVIDALKAGKSNPWYQEALRSGAVNNPVGGSFINQMKKQGSTNPISKAWNFATHGALWNTDSAIRTALFKQARETGMSEADAAAHTNKFMVNYNDLTPFEKKYMKPFISFYSWKKGNLPLQITQQLLQPGKYNLINGVKNMASEALSGQPTDQKGRVMTGESLPDGSKVAIDPYLPTDEPRKIAEKGVIPWLEGAINPIYREAAAQFGLGPYPVKYNAQAPFDYNARQGISHAINSLLPFTSSALAGEVGNVKNGVDNVVNFGADHLGGNPVNDLQNKDTPGQTTSEMIAKLLGGFTGRDNPVKDARNAQYNARNSAVDYMKYLKSTGQPIPKSLKRDAYRKVK